MIIKSTIKNCECLKFVLQNLKKEIKWNKIKKEP